MAKNDQPQKRKTVKQTGLHPVNMGIPLPLMAKIKKKLIDKRGKGESMTQDEWLVHLLEVGYKHA